VLVRLQGVQVSFGPRDVLRGVDLQHNPGEKLSLLGRNGTGKTTLLRVIAGDLEPDGGVVEWARGVEIARLEQLLAAAGNPTVLEFCRQAFAAVLAVERELEQVTRELAGGSAEAVARHAELHEEWRRLEGDRVQPRLETALQALGLPPEVHLANLNSLSGGQRTRAALVRALLAPAELLVLDEPTNHLDLLGVEFLAQQLAAREGAVLLVTHDRDLVDRMGGDILELHGGRLERYPGGFARYRRLRGERREQARRAWELQRQEIARQEEFIRRNIAGQNTRQAQARQKLLDRMERLEAPEPDLPPVRLRWVDTGRSGDRVLEAENLSVGWDRPLLQKVDLHLRRGDRLAVVGRNGAGKSTLMKVLAGRLPALAGRLSLGTGVIPGWFDQAQAELPAGDTVLDVLLAARPDWTPAEARSWAGRFAFSGEAADAATETLSGGERGRLTVARLIALGPNLMLLDEPTNHLDLITCEVLEEALQQFPGALILVSHDRRLVERVATGVLLLEQGRAVPVQDVEQAFARLGLPDRGRREERRSSAPGPRRSIAEEERRLLRRKLSRARETADLLAEELASRESRLRRIEAELCRPDVYSDPEQARALADEADGLRPQVDEVLARWETAEQEALDLESRLVHLAEAAAFSDT